MTSTGPDMSEGSSRPTPAPRLSWMGERGLLLDAAGVSFDASVQRRVWGLARALAAEPWVAEAVPGVNTLMVLTRLDGPDLAAAAELLRARWAVQTPAEETGRIVEAPVTYGGEGGGDLAALAAHAGLSACEVVRRHAAPSYSVAAIGAMPGFPYLSGLDPALACPRLATPRSALAGGSVIIGGAQAGIMPYAAPSGWRSLGVTALSLFDPGRESPVLLEPGDRVRFLIAGAPA